MYFDFLYNFYRQHFSFWEEFSEMLTQIWKFLHVKYPFCLLNFKEILIFSTDFRKQSSDVKFHQNSSNASWLVQCGRTDGRKDKRTEITKLIVAFLNFANAPEKDWIWPVSLAGNKDRLRVGLCASCVLDVYLIFFAIHLFFAGSKIWSRNPQTNNP